MEQQKSIHDLDKFELTRFELNVVLGILGKLPYDDVQQVMSVLTTRPPVRMVSQEELDAIAAELAKRASASSGEGEREVNLEAQADIGEASSPSEEEIGTEQ